MHGERIKHLREKLKLSQEDIGDSVGASRMTVSAWERGSVPNGESLAKLARALNTSIDYIMGLTDDITPPHVNAGSLSPREWAIINSLRRGDKLAAIRTIVAE